MRYILTEMSGIYVRVRKETEEKKNDVLTETMTRYQLGRWFQTYIVSWALS